MWNFMSSTFSAFLDMLKTFRFADALDILIVSFLIYSFIKLVRETRAEQLVKGILILILIWIVSSQMHLKMINSLLNNFFQFSVIAVLVLFQPEIRRALEQIGRTKLADYWLGINISSSDGENLEKLIKKSIDVICETALEFSKTKTGALIVFERQTKIGEIVDTGTIIKAVPSKQLIGNIFFNKAPLHDGAMILRNGIILAAGCILPLTNNDSLNSDLGTRHRAAIGMTEVSDAIVLIVSEETGTISLAINGVITRNYSKETLKIILEDKLLNKASENKSSSRKQHFKFPTKKLQEIIYKVLEKNEKK